MEQYEKALVECQEASRLQPSVPGYGSLAQMYVSLNRLDEAKATLEQAFAQKLDGGSLRWGDVLPCFSPGRHGADGATGPISPARRIARWTGSSTELRKLFCS
jgi:hypothetical protein